MIARRSIIIKYLIPILLASAVFIVFKHVWRGNEVPSFKEGPYFIPLKFKGLSCADIPCFEVEVEGNALRAEFDLGYDGWLTLPSSFIDKIKNKKWLNSKMNYGLSGKRYNSRVHQIPQVKINGLNFHHINVEESNEEFEKDICLTTKDESEGELGRIGRRLLHSSNLLIDYKQSLLILCDSLETLKQKNYPIESFQEVSMISDRGFIEFEAEVRGGAVRCLLDTGSTWNLINYRALNSQQAYKEKLMPYNLEQQCMANPENQNMMSFDPKDIIEMSHFRINGTEFGPITFNSIKTLLDFDVILGMEFFETTLVFIDFLQRKIYFYEPS